MLGLWPCEVGDPRCSFSSPVSGRNMIIITAGLTSVLVGGLGSSQNRGVTVAPAASLENLGDMASSGQNSTDFLGAGVKKVIIRP